MVTWEKKRQEFYRILAGVGEEIVSQNSTQCGKGWSEKLLGRGGNCCRLAAVILEILIYLNGWEQQLGPKILCRKEQEETAGKVDMQELHGKFSGLQGVLYELTVPSLNLLIYKMRMIIVYKVVLGIDCTQLYVIVQ